MQIFVLYWELSLKAKCHLLCGSHLDAITFVQVACLDDLR